MICCGIVVVANMWRSVKRRVNDQRSSKVTASHEPTIEPLDRPHLAATKEIIKSFESLMVVTKNHD